MSFGGLNRVELLKLQRVAGTIVHADTLLLLEYIKGIENENEKLRQQLDDKQETSGSSEEVIRTDEPRRAPVKRVRKGTKVRRTSSSSENN